MREQRTVLERDRVVAKKQPFAGYDEAKTAKPRYIIRFDTLADYGNYSHIAAESEDLVEVMKEADRYVKEKYQELFAVEIFGKTDKVDTDNEPLYKSVIITQVDRERKGYPMGWGYREDRWADNMYTWYQHLDEKGTRKGQLEDY